MEETVLLDGTLYFLAAAWSEKLTITINGNVPAFLFNYTHSDKRYRYIECDVKKGDIINVIMQDTTSTSSNSYAISVLAFVISK